MWYTRAIELCDSDLPGTSELYRRTVRIAKEAKIRASTSMAKQGPSTHGPFEHSVRDLNPHLQLEAAYFSDKHTLEDHEFVTPEEIGRFKRVRMIVRQFREQNGKSKADEDPLTQRRISQEQNNNDSCLPDDLKPASSDTSNPLSYLTLPRPGHSNNEAGDTRTWYEVSTDDPVYNHVYENGRRYHAVSSPTSRSYYWSNLQRGTVSRRK